MEKILFAKVNENAKIPSKRNEDAGYDIYACFEEKEFVIMPGQVRLVPTGIASAFSNDYVFVLKERGSTGTKNICQRCGIIDSGFRNQWFVPIANNSERTLIISKEYNKTIQCMIGELLVTYYPYDKAITQALLLPVPKTEIEEVIYEELLKNESERMEGMLGSSGK